jgi:phosphatidylglycerol:prolipoprotein diacylglycerol transferase
MLGYIQFPPWIRPEIVPFLPVRWYGLMYLLAFAVSYLLFRAQLKERGLEPKKDQVTDFFFWAIVGLLVGARLGFVLIYDTERYFLRNPLQIILPFARGADGRRHLTGLSGMSFHGGLVGAIVAAVTYLRVKKLDALDWGDMLVTGIPLGYTFGRLGNFINGELYGRVTRVAWGMVFPQAEGFPAKEQWVRDLAAQIGMPVQAGGLVNFPRHPSQLYEAFFEGIVLWLVLWFLVRKRRPFKGFSIAAYVIGYGIVRFFIEYTRQPDRGIGYKGLGYPLTFVPIDNPVIRFTPFNFTTGQILCLIMIVGGILAMLAFRARSRASLPQQEAPRPTGRKLRKKLGGKN